MSDDFEMDVVENERLEDLGATPDRKNQPDETRVSSDEVGTDRIEKGVVQESTSGSIQLGPKELEVPAHWKVTTFEEANVSDKPIGYGVVKPGPYVEDGIPLIRITDVVDGKLSGEEDFHRISEELDEKYNRSRLHGGELLISIQGTIGEVVVVPPELSNSNISRTLARITLSDGVNTHWAKYFLKSKEAQDYMTVVSSGSTRASYNIGDIRKTKLTLPPLPEQRKIASVLYTVDQAIQKTEAIIEQAKRVKQGVIQKLFKGDAIGSDTKFEKFRIGPKIRRLPSNWQVRPLGEIAEVNGGKRLPKDHGYADKRTDYPYLRVTDMKGGSIEPDELEYLREETHQEISKYTISSDDVYISIAGTIGVAGVIPEELDGANLTENAAKIHGLESVNRNYLALYLQSKLGQDEIFRMTVGSSQPKLSLFRIELIDVVLPPVDMQEEIASVVEGFRDKIASEQKTVSRLYTLKKGLMQDLLTGEVRTAERAIEVLDEVEAHG